MRRITADLDTKNPIIILWSLFKAIRIQPSEIYLKPSNSRGYHLVVWINREVSKKELIKLRKYLGDDPKRIAIDLKRKNPKQYLFYKKESYKKAQGW